MNYDFWEANQKIKNEMLPNMHHVTYEIKGNCFVIFFCNFVMVSLKNIQENM